MPVGYVKADGENRRAKKWYNGHILLPTSLSFLPTVFSMGKMISNCTRSKVLYHPRSQGGKRREQSLSQPVINGELSKPQCLPFAKLIILVERVSLSYSQWTGLTDEERIWKLG